MATKKRSLLPQFLKKCTKPVLAFALLYAANFIPAIAAVEGYTIGPGDILAIKVYGEPELTIDNVRVSVDGMIPYPLLGRVQVSGHTVATLEKHITYKLKQGYLYRPQVSVAIINYRPFYLKGKVKQPGAHKYSEGLKVEQAIAISGGIAEGLTLIEITLVRGNAEAMVVDGSFSVMPGDILTVKTEEIEVVQESGDFIYLYGEVRKAGSFPYREGLTVEKAIAVAGGFGPRASKRKINISREVEGEGTKKLEKVKLTEPVLPGDVITVGESWF